MQQHPIPQNVTGYKFHLVGDMTLKQFSELAFGIILAWIIFSSNMIFPLKWTLGPLAGLFGFALAFLPIEDRPLDKWIINFVKSIYSPTQFIYKALPKKLDIFSAPKTAEESQTSFQDQSNQLQDYLKTLPQSPATIFDQSEKKYLDYIKNLFGALGSPPPTSTDPKEIEITPVVKSPIKGVRVRKLHHPQMCRLPQATAPIKKIKTSAMPAKTPVKTTPPINSSGANALETTKKSKIKSTTINSSKVNIPESNKPLQNLPSKYQAASFTNDIIMPAGPEKPNLISGITIDKTGKIIPSVIIEIRDSQGLPVRALKANKLGQFFIATPLQDGVYEIAPEHPDQSFDIIKLEAKGEIIPPIKIQASK